MRLEDNKRYDKALFIKNYPKLSEKLLDRSLENLAENKNLLIFPNDFSNIKDMGSSSKLLETIDSKIKTQNIIGFIGYEKEQLNIHSRFSNGSKDYFLHYMLQKVLNINIVNLGSQYSFEEQLYQILKYLFSEHLNRALRKGIFKQYQRYEYNDLNIKGPIDVSAHIKKNTPFIGKVAYSTREFTEDNDLMQLVRHTIEYIKNSDGNGQIILNSSDITRENILAVVRSTPTYKAGERRKIILTNMNKPVRHAYYTEYLALQQLCLMILTYERHSLNRDGKNIHGILFDVAWLWEEYLNTLFEDDFEHPNNKTKEKGVSLFSDRTRTVYPDFYSRKKEEHEKGREKGREEGRVVLDAKYKKLEDSEKGISRDDLYQIISYSYIFEAKYGGIVYPSKSEAKINKKNHIGTLSGYAADIFKLSLFIPKEVKNYKEFSEEIKKNEQVVKKEINKILKKCS